MKIIRLQGANEKKIISQAVRALAKGGLIVYPSETCYGLGGDAANPKAVGKILTFKSQRRPGPISIAVANLTMAKRYVKINSTAKNIYQNLLPGPITVVSFSRGKVDPRLEAKNKTLGVRIPAHPLAQELIATFGNPITATAANTSGGKTPYTIDDILGQLSAKKQNLVDYIIDAGQLPPRPPSAVVDTTLNEPTILRQGEIDLAKLGAKSVITNSPEETQKLAHRLLKKHSHILKQKALLFALQGELGAGKTQFAKGLGRALNITQPITSPTFIIAKEYPYKLDRLRGTFHHIDAWRIAGQQENLDFLIDYLQPGNVIAIEWIQKGKHFLQNLAKNQQVKIVWIDIKHLGAHRRQIRFTD